MGKPKIGDKVFLYGQFLRDVEGFSDYEYNSLVGYATSGGYFVQLVESKELGASVPGFVIDLYSLPVYTPETLFFENWELVDVSDRLALQSPQLVGTRIFAPISGHEKTPE